MPKRTGHTINTRHSRLARTERPALLHEIAIAVVVPIANLKRLANTSESAEACPVMRGFWRLIWDALTGLVRSQAALQAEIIVLRHQLNVLRRKSPKRLASQVSGCRKLSVGHIDKDMVKAFPSNRADQPLRTAVLPR